MADQNDGQDSGRDGQNPPFVGPSVEERVAALERANVSQARKTAGDKWPIGAKLDLALIVLTIIIAWIYWQQLTEMRKATQAATRASQTAADTLNEMKNGGGATDTHTLAQQAVVQAKQTTALASAAIKQAEAAKALVAEAALQAAASKKAADAARNAADIARASLQTSERAYVIFDEPQVDVQAKDLRIPMENVGRIPSGKTRLIIHEATFNADNPRIPLDVIPPIESHWRHHDLFSVTPGSHWGTTVLLPNVSADLLNSGHQGIIVVGTVSYNDGLADTPQREWQFCFQVVDQVVLKQIFSISCEPSVWLPRIKKFDRYPYNEQSQ